jgi:HAMP domain-containing protein
MIVYKAVTTLCLHVCVFLAFIIIVYVFMERLLHQATSSLHDVEA